MPKPTREERIRAYTKTAGGCSSCYVGTMLKPMTFGEMADMLFKLKGEDDDDEGVQRS